MMIDIAEKMILSLLLLSFAVFALLVIYTALALWFQREPVGDEMTLYSIDEIVELLAEHGKTPDDVEFVMTTNGAQAGTWEELVSLEKYIQELMPPDELGFRLAHSGIQSDHLLIVGKGDWWVTVRDNVSEEEMFSFSERYVFREKPQRPSSAGPLEFWFIFNVGFNRPNKDEPSQQMWADPLPNGMIQWHRPRNFTGIVDSYEQAIVEYDKAYAKHLQLREESGKRRREEERQRAVTRPSHPYRRKRNR